MRCPKCYEEALTKNGKRWVKRDGVSQRIQQFQCQACGHITYKPLEDTEVAPHGRQA